MVQVHMQNAVHTTLHFTCWFGIGCEVRCDDCDVVWRRRFQTVRAVSVCSRYVGMGRIVGPFARRSDEHGIHHVSLTSHPTTNRCIYLAVQVGRYDHDDLHYRSTVGTMRKKERERNPPVSASTHLSIYIYHAQLPNKHVMSRILCTRHPIRFVPTGWIRSD